MTGQIAELRVSDFQHFSERDPLVEVDDAIYRQKLPQVQAVLAEQEAALAGVVQDRLVAEAQIRSAKARQGSARAQLAISEANLERGDKLRSRGVVATRAPEDAKLTRDQSRATQPEGNAADETARQKFAALAATRQSLKAAVESGKAAVSLAQIDLDNTLITAPMAGRLGEVSVRVGQYVTQGTRIVPLVAPTVWVVANFKETKLAAVAVGQPVNFAVDALCNASLRGRIERFSPATGSEFSLLPACNATGNFIKIAQRLPVHIRLKEGQALTDRLTPGLSVVARVDTAVPHEAAGAAPSRARDGR